MSQGYPYTIVGGDHFPNDLVSIPRLKDEIEAHSWTYKYEGSSTDGTSVMSVFADTLPAEEVTVLSSIMAAHSGAAPTESTEAAKDAEGALVARLKKASWGRNFCMRPLVFTTSKLGSLTDKDWQGVDNGGATQRFYKDVSGDMVEITGADLNQTFLTANCVETRLEVRYDEQIVEIDTATLFVPDTLAGDDDEAWSYAMIIAPTTVYAMGITCLIPLRFYKGEVGRYNKLAIGQGVEVMKIEPDMLGGYPVTGGHIMHFILRHPTGAQTEFMLEGICYR